MQTSLKKKVLVVEDEVSVLGFVKHSLEASGFEVAQALTGNEALKKARELKPDVIILDYGLPDISGLEVLKSLREWSKIPIIFLTARDSEEDKVEILDNGADDYLTKPFGVPELLARVRVALRHNQNEEDSPVFKAGALEIDRSAHIVRVSGTEIKLTATEYQLLCLLAKNAGKVVPHRTVLKEIWGPNSVEHNHYLRVYFGQIRKKIENVTAGASAVIENESGVGYRLKA